MRTWAYASLLVAAAGCGEATAESQVGATGTASGATAGAKASGAGAASTTTTTTSGTGAGGNGGSPPVQILDCDGLGAVDVWENVTPPGVTAVIDVVRDPVHAGTLYVGTIMEGIHKSSDCGATWTKVNTGRNGDTLDSGMQWSMALDPIETNVLYAINLYGSDLSLFKSVDDGVNWDPAWSKDSEVATTVEYNFAMDVAMDPTDRHHLIVSFHANCTGVYAPMCLAESTDAGASWRLFKGPMDGWSEDSGVLILGGASFLYQTNGPLFYTGDSGATWEKVGDGGGGHQLYHSDDGYYYMGSLAGVRRSPDGHTWTTLPDAPRSDAVIGDGDRLFASDRLNSGQPHYTAPERDGTQWSTLPSPDMPKGAHYYAYEANHHVLYAAQVETGLWRMVTQ